MYCFALILFVASRICSGKHCIFEKLLVSRGTNANWGLCGEMPHPWGESEPPPPELGPHRPSGWECPPSPKSALYTKNFPEFCSKIFEQNYPKTSQKSLFFIFFCGLGRESLFLAFAQMCGGVPPLTRSGGLDPPCPSTKPCPSGLKVTEGCSFAGVLVFFVFLLKIGSGGVVFGGFYLVPKVPGLPWMNDDLPRAMPTADPSGLPALRGSPHPRGAGDVHRRRLEGLTAGVPLFLSRCVRQSAPSRVMSAVSVAYFLLSPFTRRS